MRKCAFALPDVFIRKQPAGDLSIPVHPNDKYADYKSATGKIRIHKSGSAFFFNFYKTKMAEGFSTIPPYHNLTIQQFFNGRREVFVF